MKKAIYKYPIKNIECTTKSLKDKTLSCRLHKIELPTSEKAWEDFDDIGFVDLEKSHGRFMGDGFSARFHEPTVCTVFEDAEMKKDDINYPMWKRYIECDSAIYIGIDEFIKK